ncbi:phosphoglycolate phosphatase [Ferriphaselus sp. R-1]|uniref:phosphoglycolate phosphatase n=1 Tax=Ferriphaselus sp. R-1 TaxID=1485544 RepID=UPI0005544312|nr:phosphoglycolate phosphatase [Ferriphaselus sp. R-1]
MTKAVLFDLDGTFADTAADLAAAANHVRAQHGMPPLPLELLRPQASHGSVGLLKVAMNVTPQHDDFSAMREIFLDHYASHIQVHTELFPGMAELVDVLEQRGLPWGIVTNKPHRFTLPLMQALGYAERAACLVSGDTCAHAKPHPEPMLHAAALAGVGAADCLYLGDDLRDVQAAHAAGMRCLVAAYGYLGDHDPRAWNADGIIATPPELIPHLTR